jgi:hypothetical protein
MKDRNVKKVRAQARAYGIGRVNEESKGGRIWSMHFLYMCEYGTLKPVEVI